MTDLPTDTEPTEPEDIEDIGDVEGEDEQADPEAETDD